MADDYLRIISQISDMIGMIERAWDRPQSDAEWNGQVL